MKGEGTVVRTVVVCRMGMVVLRDALVLWGRVGKGTGEVGCCAVVCRRGSVPRRAVVGKGIVQLGVGRVRSGMVMAPSRGAQV